MGRRLKLALVTTIIGSGVVFLDGTVVNLALPNITQHLGASFAQLQWIVDGFLLSLSSLILLGGSLGDILGRKRIYLLGLAGFGAASLLSGLAPNTQFLIAMRLLQGVFGAMVVPGALAIINTNFPKELRGKAFGTWTAWSGITSAIGPLVGGYLVDRASWRWVFLINVPLILICLVLGQANIKESRDQKSRHIDYPGAALAMIALGGTTYGLIEGPAKHWQVAALAPLLIGLMAALIFIAVEARVKDPMVHLKLFRSHNFSAANVATFAMYGALGGFLFAFLIHLQSVVGFSSKLTGTIVLPVTLMLLLLSSRVGALAAKYGPRAFMTVGPIVAGLGMFSLIGLRAGSSYLTAVLPGVLVFSLGLAITVAPLTITVMGSVDETSSGIASGINNAVARAAGLIVVALVGIFGAGQAYHFAIILCSLMAVGAGLLSLALVQNPIKAAK